MPKPNETTRPAWRRHLPEYLIEAWGLGVFMLSAGFFGTLLEYPGSPVHGALPEPLLRRILMGLAMGLTAIGLIYSPWGRQSGAHLNPAVTLTFVRLRKVRLQDGLFYVAAQFLGGSSCEARSRSVSCCSAWALPFGKRRCAASPRFPAPAAPVRPSSPRWRSRSS